MPIAAIPAAISAGGSIGAALLGRHEARQAAAPTAEENAALKGRDTAATTLANQGTSLFRQAQPQIQQAGRYFSTLAGGNRAATSQMLAPDVENINKTYGGTRRNLSRFLRGPNRDYQLGELERERAGSVGSLFRDARGNATAKLLESGMSLQGAGASATGGAGALFGGSAGQRASNRFAGADLERQSGSDYGNLVFQLMKGMGGGGKGSSSAPSILPSRQTVFPMASGFPGGG